ncbi:MULTISPECIES: MAC/perforin domain-containing protein [unclassified Oceanispirochaeta]|uniref:MAC/perforin domain-containing protein n=1 Tax=unclassified Oceanispirochaeta TaxID=2635722 RepID=UPI0011C03564|nr:MAC/perforin domain-containing protein [Oceanispirochaeta sp. M1]MBF9014404.1 hypothetical protein [Oceanispirochaeta sp. M2]NPD71290.1 hypothetical protein [Oceanispirochaeta sp. M1]
MISLKKPLVLLILVSFFYLSGCDLIGSDENKEDANPVNLQTAGLDVIGKGYDIFDPYADPEEVKDPILDVNALLELGLIDMQDINKGDFTSSSGATYSEYFESFKEKTKMSGNYNFYSGSVNQSFARERFESTAYNFATIHSDIKKHALLINDRSNGDFLVEYLTPEFKTALDNPDDNSAMIFENYGTHLLTGIIVGARLDYNYSARKNTSSGSEDIKLSAKASYKTLFKSATLSVDTSSHSNWESWYSDAEWTTTVIGGKPEYGQGIQSDGEYKDWIDSIDSHPVFSNVYDRGVFPIWELAPTPEKRTQMEQAYDVYAQGKSVNTIPTDPPRQCIIDFYIHYGKQRESVIDINNRKYYLVNQDLNEDAGGEWTFLYVCFGNDDGTSGLAPITDIAITYSGGETAAKNDAGDYEIIGLSGPHNGDLNKGTGGDYLYLCVSRASGEPLTDVYTKDSDGDYRYPYSFEFPDLGYDIVKRREYNHSTDVDADLNKEAGGDDIWLYFSKSQLD